MGVVSLGIDRVVPLFAKNVDNKRIRAAKEVESFFLYMVLKELKKTLPSGSLFPSVRGDFIYDYMVTEALAKDLARKASVLGFDRMLFEEERRKGV